MRAEVRSQPAVRVASDAMLTLFRAGSGDVKGISERGAERPKSSMEHTHWSLCDRARYAVMGEIFAFPRGFTPGAHALRCSFNIGLRPPQTDPTSYTVLDGVSMSFAAAIASRTARRGSQHARQLRCMCKSDSYVLIKAHCCAACV